MTDETLAAELARHGTGDRLETRQQVSKDLALAKVIDRCLVDLRILEKQFKGHPDLEQRLKWTVMKLEREYAEIVRKYEQPAVDHARY